jgi:GDP-4-dehydro-6-deoxy-D-mannose reductase
MPRAIITGLKGFVGPYLAAELRSAGIEPIGISVGDLQVPHPIPLDDLTIHEIDIRDREGVKKIFNDERPELVFHLAAVSHVPTSRANPGLTYDVNVGGTLNILEAARLMEKPPRVLFVSTGNLYGDQDSGESGFNEQSPLQTKSPYSTSKLMGEELALSYSDEYGLEVVVARPFNHTGPGQAPSFVCSQFARDIAEKLAQGQPVHIKTGALGPKRDFSDVRDVVRAYFTIAKNGRAGEIYNVSSGTLVSIREIIEMLSKVAGTKVTTEQDPSKLRAREIMRSGGDSSKLRTELGWSPLIPLEATLRDLLDYWKKQYPNSKA